MKIKWDANTEQTLEDYDKIKMSNTCDCSCHGDEGNVMHCVPCCTRCQYCRKDKILDLQEHLEHCTNFLFHHNQEGD
jgi:hypothetical protein